MANPIPYNQLFEIDGLTTAIGRAETAADQFGTAATEDMKRIQSATASLRKEIEAINATLSANPIKLNTEAGQQQVVAYADAIAKLTKQYKDQQAQIASLNSVLSSNKQAIADAKTQAEQYKAQLQGQKVSTEAVRTAIAQTILQTRQLTLANQQAKNAVTAATGSYREAQQRLTALGNSIKNAKDGFNSANPAVKAQIDAYNELNNKMKAFDAQMGNHQRNVGNYGGAIGGLINSLNTLASSYFSLYGALRLVTSVIKENEAVGDILANVKQEAKLTTEEVNQLEEALKKIDTRTTLQNLSKLAAIGALRGIPKEDLAAYTEALNNVVLSLGNKVSGGPEAVAGALTKLNALFGVNSQFGIVGGLEKTGSALAVLGQRGLITADNLTEFSVRVAASANLAKLSAPQVLSYGAAFQQAGFESENAGTAFNKLLAALGTKREKFFAIAQLGDAKLTLKEFTHLINTDTDAALKKFFVGLSSGNATQTDFRDRLSELGLKAGNVTSAVIGLAEQQKELKTVTELATQAFNDGTVSAEQAALKNDTLAGSIDKLGNNFTKLTTSGAIANFFKAITDGLADALSWFDKLANAKSTTEVMDRFWTITKRGKSDDDRKYRADDSIQPFFQSKSLIDQAQSTTNPLENKDLQDKIQGQLKINQTGLIDLRKLYAELQNNKNAGTIDAEDTKTLETVAKYIDGIKEQTEILKTFVKTTAQVKNDTSSTLNVVGKTADSDLKTVKEINRRIKELKDDALANPKNKNSDVSRIEALKERLKELNGSAKQVKDSFEKLEEQMKQTMHQLNGSIVDDYVKNQGKEGEHTIALASKYNKLNAELYRLQQLKAAALRGNFVIPATNKPSSNNIPTNDKATAKLNKTDTVNGLLSDQIGITNQLGDSQNSTSEELAKQANLYAQGLITKRQYEAKRLQLEKEEAALEYGIMSKLYNSELQLAVEKYGEDSKEYRDALAKRIRLREDHSKKNIAITEAEQAATEAIYSDIFKTLENSTNVLSQQLGGNTGKFFSDFTNQLKNLSEGGKETFADFAQVGIDATNAYTEHAINASRERKAVLEREMNYEIEGAGKNATAKKLIQDQFTKKINEEKRKQAIIAKSAAIVDIAINTAVAVSKTLATASIFGIPLIPIIVGLGAIEAGLVAAQPIPAYEKGRKGGKAEVALVNERGPELIGKNGNYRIANQGKKGYTMLDSGDTVHTAHATKNMFVNREIEYLNRSSIEIGKSKAIYDTYIMNSANSNKIDYDAIGNAVGEKLANMPVADQIWDDRGHRTYTRIANTRIRDVRNRNGL